ncbi:apolipoprotein N-acyltransferase [Paraurantiacibacter namhicola]|uniref:Apolipoprotein N-acyltransferase n=1 Tax=Paraurantiacibacter namhicola TaxID=645517 RepID=A0A1C7D513_9SPHN|nr:apolipoprotein N-acyltransferase [Paraurantiacibacter namhicola]ANU06544.1 Apolipoprotein N-acyltransferase [Paraurantiacibacter namhicola]
MTAAHLSGQAGQSAMPAKGANRLLSVLSARPALASLVLGLVSATGFQPLGLWPLALLATGLFALLLQAVGGGWKRGAWLGWLFGLTHFTFGNSWIATAFTFQSNMPEALGWLAVPLLSVYLAVYPALAAALAMRLSGPHRGMIPLVFFAAAWIVTEWLRSWVFTGFAWNPLGMMLLGPFDRPGLAALTPWLGTYALSGLTILAGGGTVLALAEKRFATAGLSAALLAAGMYWPAAAPREGTLPVTLVQPNLTPTQISDPASYETNFLGLAAASLPLDRGETRLVLWPESALADYLEYGYPQRYYDRTTALGSPRFARQRVARTLGGGSLLLTGNITLDFEGGKLAGVGNSVIALDDESEIRGIYDKAHLVPYGEYLPLRSLLEPIGLSRLVPGSVDFRPGPGPRTLELGTYGNAGIQICYEIIFSGQVVDRGNRPDYIFNPSTDGWFGYFGPPQHLAQARMRAIEEGLPVLRATTTGISAVIDARGVVREHAPMNVARRIDTRLPPAHAPTLFARAGNVLPLGWALFLLLAGLVALRRNAR